MQGRLVTLRWATDDDYTTIANWLRPLSPASALTGDNNEFITPSKVKAANEEGNVRFFIALTESGEKVGAVNYRLVNSAGSYAIGGVVGDWRRWSRGYGADAFGLLVEHLFNGLNAHRIEFATAAYNKETLKIFTKGGFVLEGLLRDYHFIDGMYYDRTLWSILREEFYEYASENAKLFPVVDAVPASDKAEARELFRKFLANDPQTSFNDFEKRSGRTRPY